MRPPGGYKLNEFRNTVPSADGSLPHSWVNVFHDDPDANEFALAVGNGFAFHPGVYSQGEGAGKTSADHSTITIDNKGQDLMPPNSEDVTKFSYLTGWKADDKGHVIIEGETDDAYRGQTWAELHAAQYKATPPSLKTFRRTAIWMPKEYILILDNIAADSAPNIMWRCNAPKSTVTGSTWTATTETDTPVNFQVVSNKDIKGASTPMNLIGRWGTVPLQQVQYSANTDAIKFAAVLNPWKTNPEVKMTESGGVVTVTVHSASYDDTWTWKEAKDATTPSQIEGQRGGAPLISLTEADKAPTN